MYNSYSYIIIFYRYSPLAPVPKSGEVATNLKPNLDFLPIKLSEPQSPITVPWPASQRPDPSVETNWLALAIQESIQYSLAKSG